MLKIAVDECPAGPQMDAAVAGVLGIKRGKCEPHGISTAAFSTLEGWKSLAYCRWCRGRIENGIAGLCPKYPFPPYSTDIAAAWKLLPRMQSAYGILLGILPNMTECKIMRDDKPIVGRSYSNEPERDAHAICRAFLKSQGVTHVEVPE